jgi:hypothetical protein
LKCNRPDYKNQAIIKKARRHALGRGIKMIERLLGKEAALSVQAVLPSPFMKEGGQEGNDNGDKGLKTSRKAKIKIRSQI